MRGTPVTSPDAYVAALDGWRKACVRARRAAVLDGARLEEVVRWGHLVYFRNGPVPLIRAERERVLLGFGRGQRHRAIEPRLTPGGRYEMATLASCQTDRSQMYRKMGGKVITTIAAHTA